MSNMVFNCSFFDDMDKALAEFLAEANKVFSRAEPVMQLTIHYKDGSEYNVKNAFNIKMNKHKSGGFDIEYDYEYTVTKNLPHGSENSEVAKHVETKTHDVIAITLTERKQNNVRKTEIVEFGK